jgi:hypothetical protein
VTVPFSRYIGDGGRFVVSLMDLGILSSVVLPNWSDVGGDAGSDAGDNTDGDTGVMWM